MLRKFVCLLVSVTAFALVALYLSADRGRGIAPELLGNPV